MSEEILMKKTYLLAPGPTPVPSEALLAMSRPILHHRAPEYEKIFSQVREGLKYVFQTQTEVLIFASSGTGGMEGAVVNTLSPGDKALVVRGGKFGERWGEICQAYGVNFEAIDVEWGKPVDPALIAEALKRDGAIKAVFVTHSETSTGVLNDLEAIAEIVRNTPAILVVDAITSLGVVPVPVDEWGLDVVVAGSQKALMLPPGLAFCSVSEKAWRMVETSRLPKYYFNFKEEKKNIEKNQSAFTPAVSLLLGLKETLDLIKAEGLENIFARHDRLARATRAGVTALGLELFTESPSPAVTAVKAPTGIDGGTIVKTLRTKHGITIAGGQSHLKGKIFRIAHLGYADTYDVVIAMAALELTLSELGYPVKLGSGVRAAEEILMK
ncbi:MAG: alanine--glyoxylate aminotransferase family protein [candidate division NC10 bacterium]|nr:alanine--glyoxylate aminotransferase family protein [candidate division NC10 bacterium]